MFKKWLISVAFIALVLRKQLGEIDIETFQFPLDVGRTERWNIGEHDDSYDAFGQDVGELVRVRRGA